MEAAGIWHWTHLHALLWCMAHSESRDMMVSCGLSAVCVLACGVLCSCWSWCCQCWPVRWPRLSSGVRRCAPARPVWWTVVNAASPRPACPRPSLHTPPHSSWTTTTWRLCPPACWTLCPPCAGPLSTETPGHVTAASFTWEDGCWNRATPLPYSECLDERLKTGFFHCLYQCIVSLCSGQFFQISGERKSISLFYYLFASLTFKYNTYFSEWDFSAALRQRLSSFRSSSSHFYPIYIHIYFQLII